MTKAGPSVDPVTDHTISEADFDCLSGEGKIIFNLLSKKLDSIINEIREKDEKISHLETENRELKNKIQKIEQRQDDLETQTRANNIVLSGDAVSSVKTDIPAQGVIELLSEKLQYSLSPENIIIAFRIGTKLNSQSGDNRRFMIKLCDPGLKNDILTACRRAKPSGLVANDDLPPVRANILYILRQAKRRSNGMIVSCQRWALNTSNVFKY